MIATANESVVSLSAMDPLSILDAGRSKFNPSFWPYTC
jgi:hypothetical protein